MIVRLIILLAFAVVSVAVVVLSPGSGSETIAPFRLYRPKRSVARPQAAAVVRRQTSKEKVSPMFDRYKGSSAHPRSLHNESGNEATSPSVHTPPHKLPRAVYPRATARHTPFSTPVVDIRNQTTTQATRTQSIRLCKPPSTRHIPLPKLSRYVQSSLTRKERDTALFSFTTLYPGTPGSAERTLGQAIRARNTSAWLTQMSVRRTVIKREAGSGIVRVGSGWRFWDLLNDALS